ncbi:glycoprotein 3-alpha-L-fucosyltransferase A-like [Lingula anatina]|uniref:Fucosyltransferase n=1 Tax=Lingula anatina TaxID=7574 RepID=A0A1S3HAK9_LINAN|nr:glycoprotein 3-alpha-L-fucosyltransferase A-like [Lingula anatina]|eukprot:XP_013382491.1 glycoprotein 3-alpha-L-fucosyltransferase A-like [Lingula anatina]
MISHCKTGSERSSYIKLLRKYMPVDVYGSCGEMGKRNSTEYNSLFGKYKFYLAFENNFLKEYLTEKFFNTVDYDVVAVTRGGANYSDLGIKPEWHIDTQDFSSPKELAQYLLRLDKNDTLYAQHLLWKNYYQIPPGWSWTTNLLCTLCSKVHNTSEPIKWYTKQQLIQNFYEPWCQKPNDLPDH